MSDANEAEILFERRGGLVVVTLNRPRALNALTLPMIQALDDGLRAWRSDPEVHAVLVKGAGERAFCAGGDIRAIHGIVAAGQVAEAVAFYAVEYPMNHRLHRFEKPYIALLDGITMGGGVGVSVHGSHRVVTERTLFAMPETGIGLFPDVGGTHFLPRLPGALGTYLGLTGARLGAADCLHAEIGTHAVDADRLAELEAALARADLSGDAFATIDAILADLRSDPGPPTLAADRERIDRCFGVPDLSAVLQRLGAASGEWEKARLAELATKSPTSLAITFEQLRRGADLDFAAAMRLEYRLVHRFMAGHDFPEGVRALIIDKDNQPHWRPSELAALTPSVVEGYFAPLPGGDLVLEV